MTRIMITHDMSVVATSCNKVAIMYAGELMEMRICERCIKNSIPSLYKGLLSSFPSLREKGKIRSNTWIFTRFI